jgi:phage shock protein B
MEEVLIPVLVVGMLFIGLPWLIFHYVTKWKSAATLTGAEEKILD